MPDQLEVEQLAETLEIEPTLATLLLQRGINDKQKAERFFNPSLENTYDPFLLKDMDVAIERIERAIANRESVMVYGDYDVDGITSTALLLNFFSSYIEKMYYYIPDRYAEGYGISQKGIDYAATNNVKLIITVDCGIKAVEEVKYANSLGVDFIVSDHHLPDDELPPAIAVVDPKRLDCNYPYKELSGCGVAFKIVQAFAARRDIPLSELTYMLDLVAVSIAADIVPLTDENRVLAHFGLKQLNSRDVNLGLSKIIEISALRRGSITIEDIIFKIGPRINATGRMEIDIDPDDPKAQSGGRSAVRLMTAKDSSKAKKYVDKIEEENNKRKSADRVVTLEARDIIASDSTQQGKTCTIIYHPEWKKGVVGIVASRLIESYYRPTVVLTDSNGMVTGSARSIPGFDLYAAIESCSDLLENFGGHTYAVGLTMKPENLEIFCERFERYVDENITAEKFEQIIVINMEVSISDITSSFRKNLQRLAPFGPGNPSPIFATLGVRDNGSARKVGMGGEHLKMAVYEPTAPRYTIEAIGFSYSKHYPHVKSGGHIDVCYNITENHYAGKVSPQLKLKDIKQISL